MCYYLSGGYMLLFPRMTTTILTIEDEIVTLHNITRATVSASTAEHAAALPPSFELRTHSAGFGRGYLVLGTN